MDSNFARADRSTMIAVRKPQLKSHHSLRRCKFIFKHSQACIVVDLGPYSTVYYEVFQYSVTHLCSGTEVKIGMSDADSEAQTY